MKNLSLKEFRPTIFFLLKFVGFYLIANILYGVYVTAYSPSPDPATKWVSAQSAALVTACGWPTVTIDHPRKPTTQLLYDNRPILAVYEGCNGINTIIIFLAFVFAFGPPGIRLLWFIPLGILVIHLANLLRISLLFFVAEHRPDFMYFFHKYLFTASLYVVIFLLWITWVKLNSRKRES
jgi:exosortase family protein XrtF